VLARIPYDSARKSVVQHAEVVAELAAGRAARAAARLREHIRMNAALAEDMARRHPEFFTPAADAAALAALSPRHAIAAP
jgi:DNA-binding GntR family transcriptional regulator